MFDYESICYACGLPPEICTCPELHPRKKKLKLHEFPGPNGQTRKLKKALCEPSMFRQREGVVVTQSSFHRFDEGFPVVDEESEDNRQVPLGDWDDRRTSYPTLRAEKTFLTR